MNRDLICNVHKGNWRATVARRSTNSHARILRTAVLTTAAIVALMFVIVLNRQRTLRCFLSGHGLIGLLVLSVLLSTALISIFVARSRVCLSVSHRYSPQRIL